MKASAAEFARQGEKYLGRPYSKMDCQAFVERMLHDVGIPLDLPGSNAWFRRMTWVGTPEDCVRLFGEVPVGAFLFIWKQDGKEPEKYRADGKGNATHIGVRTAAGAIHSSSSRGCVAESDFHERTIRCGWNRVGLWEALDYGDQVAAFFGEPLPDEEEKQMKEAKVIGGALMLRKAKSTGAAILARMPDGASVTVTENDGTWATVTFEGMTGYAMARYLNMTEAPVPEPVMEEELITLKLPKETAYWLYDALGAAIGEGVGALG